MTWPLVTVDQIKAKKRYSLVGGPFGSNLVTKDYREDGVPVIRGGNVPGDKAFSFDDLVFVSEEKADQLLPNNAFPGDLVVTQRGTLGQVGLIPLDSPYPRFVISQSQMSSALTHKSPRPSSFTTTSVCLKVFSASRTRRLLQASPTSILRS